MEELSHVREWDTGVDLYASRSLPAEDAVAYCVYTLGSKTNKQD